MPEAITKRAHDTPRGAGGVGLEPCRRAVPIELDRWDVASPSACTYKYLNAGRGAPAFLYVKRDLAGSGLVADLGLVRAKNRVCF